MLMISSQLASFDTFSPISPVALIKIPVQDRSTSAIARVLKPALWGEFWLNTTEPRAEPKHRPGEDR
jgi:hypothetical protein